ncbi:MAG TPA: prolyl oligopeptidase family serine peptidase [Candidatus Acidoferrum sp.]|nr:prolyl oligopeptidase family serine peptidase [Candidatus Acidoferrum sp.]
MRRVLAWAAACSSFVAVHSAAAQSNTKQTTYETAFYPSGELKIEAYVFKLEGPGPFPVVIYNHGSRPGHEREERPFAYVGELLVRNGYVVVVPERRGYGKSDGVTFGEAVGEDRGPRFVTRVQEETDDMLAAVEFVKTLPYVDPKRMGVMGWSFRGIVSVFGANRSTAFRAVVDQAGAALTWDHSPAMQAALKEAAGKIRIPLLGMVAQNDRTTESVKAVVREAEKHGATTKLIVYPAFIPQDAGGVARGHMVIGREGWRVWEADLKEFLGKFWGTVKKRAKHSTPYHR